MIKWMNHILSTLMIVTTVVFIGYGVYVCWDYTTHPEVYTWYSAPWYTGIYVYGILAITILIALSIIKLIIRKTLNKKH